MAITVRDLRFGRNARQDRWWLGEDAVATAFFNALSVSFPKGEAFFIESVRAFRDGAKPGLAEDIAAFSRQEVIHTREHVAFNRRIVEAGYDISRLEAQVDRRLSLLRSKPPIAGLAATMALEHFTALFARALVADPRHLAGAPEALRRMWLWHALEEIEHKSVAYDTWLHATRDWTRWRRWRLKAKVMLLVTRNFTLDRTRGALDLLDQDGLRGPRLWLRLAYFAFVRPGIVRRIAAGWLSYFMPGFHPWNHDDRPLIIQAEQALAGPAAA